jgi:CubicO group peptidase (beta-lactamase class C family)
MQRYSTRSNARSLLSRLILVAASLVQAAPAPGQTSPTLGQEIKDQIDRIAQQALSQTGVPSASVALVKDGQIAYVRAYGAARLEPFVSARPEMRYSIGSISKQFTAAAVLMLAEQHKLSLDDPVSKYIPHLTRGREVTIRQLLSHTSGYQDYWPQDYVPPFMRQLVTAEKIIDLWARKPLDFDPGTKWQYSNTNYVIAGVIVEKVSGKPLLDFLQERMFTPLGMQRVDNIDVHQLPQTDATGYMRYALGPPRIAPKEGPGWLFAAGELAMPASELAKWDISLLGQRLLKPESYKEMETEVKLKDGSGTGYALGLQVGSAGNHRMVRHGGEVSGFTAQNIVFPDDDLAVVVLTNQDAAAASSLLAIRIGLLLLTPQGTGSSAKLEQARAIFTGLQQGKIDRSLFTDNANAYFTEQALQDFASSLGALGTPQDFALSGERRNDISGLQGDLCQAGALHHHLRDARRQAGTVPGRRCRLSGVLTHSLLDARRSLGQIVGIHRGMELQMSVERQEPGLGDGRDLGRVAHIEEDIRRALAVILGKVRGLRLQFRDDTLNRLAQRAGLRGGVGFLRIQNCFQHESHDRLLVHTWRRMGPSRL